jgi:hypothetical protein
MMKKNGLIIGILALFCTLTAAQNFTISATYGFKSMSCLRQKSPPPVDCPMGNTQLVPLQFTKTQLTTKSILATFLLNKKWAIALGYQEDEKGALFREFGDETPHLTTASYRGITLGFQYNFLQNRHFMCHLNNYLTPELRRFFNGRTDELSKDVSVSYVGGLGVDVKLWRLIYWTTNAFSEVALRDYKRDESGEYTFLPVAFGINSGVKIMF